MNEKRMHAPSRSLKNLDSWVCIMSFQQVQIHDGPYNALMNWDYEGMVKSLNNGQGRLWTAKVCPP